MIPASRARGKGGCAIPPSFEAKKVITIPAEPADASELPPALQPVGAVPPLVFYAPEREKRGQDFFPPPSNFLILSMMLIRRVYARCGQPGAPVDLVRTSASPSSSSAIAVR
jgi:hypothetical protein